MLTTHIVQRRQMDVAAGRQKLETSETNVTHTSKVVEDNQSFSCALFQTISDDNLVRRFTCLGARDAAGGCRLCDNRQLRTPVLLNDGASGNESHNLQLCEYTFAT